jgi:hypothetical protein
MGAKLQTPYKSYRCYSNAAIWYLMDLERRWNGGRFKANPEECEALMDKIVAMVDQLRLEPIVLTAAPEAPKQ